MQLNEAEQDARLNQIQANMLYSTSLEVTTLTADSPLTQIDTGVFVNDTEIRIYSDKIKELLDVITTNKHIERNVRVVFWYRYPAGHEKQQNSTYVYRHFATTSGIVHVDCVIITPITPVSTFVVDFGVMLVDAA